MCSNNTENFITSIITFTAFSIGLICTMVFWYGTNLQTLNTIGQGACYIYSQTIIPSWCNQYACWSAFVTICAPNHTTNCVQSYVNTFDTYEHAKAYLSARDYIGMQAYWCYYYPDGTMIGRPDITSPIILAVFISIGVITCLCLMICQTVGYVKRRARRNQYTVLGTEGSTHIVTTSTHIVNVMDRTVN